MRRKLWNRCENEKGSALVLVLIVFVVFLLLSSALLTSSVVSNAAAFTEVKSQQAYMTARSAVDATIKSINTDSSFESQIENLTVGQTIQGNGSDTAMGGYAVTIAKTSSTSITVSATSTVKNNAGQTLTSQTTKAYLNTEMYDASNPFDYITNYTNTASQNNPHVVEGAIPVNGNLNYNGCASISQGGNHVRNHGSQNVTGNVFATGKIWLSGSSSALTKLASLDDITLSTQYYDLISNGGWCTDDSPASINCDVLTEKSLTLSSGSSIGSSSHSANVNTNGNITLNNSVIYGNVTCGGNIILNGSSSINGTVRAKGTITGTGSVIGTKTQNDSSVPLVSINYTPQPNLPTNIGYGGNGDDSIDTTATNVSIQNKNSYGLITSSGILNSNNFHAFNSYNTIVIDTGTISSPSNAIRLIINSSLTLNNDTLIVRGNNNVFIYLANGANLTFNNGNMGMATSNTSTTLNTSSGYSSKIFIIGNNQTISFNGNSFIAAYFYIPGSSGLLTGNWSTGNYFGSMVIPDDSLTLNPSYCALTYFAPNLTGTPLEGFAKGVYSTGKWAVKGYAKS